MQSVFISYAHEDIQFVEQLEADLRDARYTVWRDRTDIRRGVNWDHDIEVVLRSGNIDHVLFVQSKHSIESEMVLNELEEARENRIKFIVPLILDDSRTPLLVKRRNHIDFRVDYDLALSLLLEELAQSTDQLTVTEQAPQLVVTRKPTPSQRIAAHESATRVRLLAGPGTGKSFVIEERVRWLLGRGIAPKSIFVVSFTRASSNDLKRRIIEYSTAHSQSGVYSVRVSTLHSLALTALRKSGRLAMYPVTPIVLDKWELENIFDAEFKQDSSGVFARKNGRLVADRAEQIRRFSEAQWSTGDANPRDYMMPEIPISDGEQADFVRFHRDFTQTYACVLPGEIIEGCASM